MIPPEIAVNNLLLPIICRKSQKLSQAKKWISESFASFAMPSESEFQKICLKKSQFVNSVSSFLPKSVLSGE